MINRFFLTVSAVGLSLLSIAQVPADSGYLRRDFQFTFVTPMGTNGIQSHKCINRVSINLFGGVSAGLEGIEVGGFSNVVRKNVHGIQLAGFSNAVFGNVTGLQGAGFVNYSGGDFFGLAGAGFCNVNLGKTTGGQFSGFANYNGDSLYGAQMSGFANCNLGDFKGIQASGFVNFNRKNFIGLQGAGFVNVSGGQFKGAQLAGFANLNRGNIEGVQASGFVNVAKKVKGAQVGFINIADSIDGVSIGFLSVVKNGLHQVEFSADEMGFTNMAIRTGTHKFYNVFEAGFTSRNGGLLWHMGYGIGSSVKINDKFRADAVLSSHHVSKGLLYAGTSELYKLYLGVEYKIAPKMHLAAGPTFNLYLGDALLPAFEKTYSKIAPYTLLNETNTNGFNYKAWVGGKIAIRFF